MNCLRDIKNIKKLTRLKLDNTSIKNLQFVKDLNELRHLDIRNTEVTSLEPIQFCKKLINQS